MPAQDRFTQKQPWHRTAYAETVAAGDGIDPGQVYTAVIRSNLLAENIVEITIPILSLSTIRYAHYPLGHTPTIGEAAIVIADQEKNFWTIFPKDEPSSAISLKGAFSEALTYLPGDIVKLEGGLWLCIAESKKVQPNKSLNEKWIFLVPEGMGVVGQFIQSEGVEKTPKWSKKKATQEHSCNVAGAVANGVIFYASFYITKANSQEICKLTAIVCKLSKGEGRVVVKKNGVELESTAVATIKEEVININKVLAKGDLIEVFFEEGVGAPENLICTVSIEKE